MNRYAQSHLKRNSSWFATAIPFVLMLALLGSQTVSVQHHHDDDLAHHLDCSICVKQSSDTDFLLPIIGVPEVEPTTGELADLALIEVARAPLNFNSRAPPFS